MDDFAASPARQIIWLIQGERNAVAAHKRPLSAMSRRSCCAKMARSGSHQSAVPGVADDYQHVLDVIKVRRLRNEHSAGHQSARIHTNGCR